MRTSFVKEMLIEVEADVAHAAILARLGDDTAGRIRAETPVAWVDAADFEALVAAVVDAAGDDALHRISRRHFLRFRDSPFMKATIDAMVRIFGLTPHTVLKNLPRGRGSLVKDGGFATYDKVDDTSCRLTLREFHPSRWAVALVNLTGTWHGVFDICHVQGTITVEREDAVAGNVDFIVRWR